MKLSVASTISLALGASALVPDPNQHLLGSKLPSFLSSAFDQAGDLPSEVVSAWLEVAKLYPDDTISAIQAITSQSNPKAGIKERPDSEWDHIVDGSKTVSMLGSLIDGHDKLKGTKLRIKDPSRLGVDPGVKQYSGYLDVDEDDKHFFFWFFESRNDPKNDPVVLWLNGGPGCSSLTGLFMELGPSSINSKIHTVNNPYSWNSNASVIFLDQPVNVGYSYSRKSVKSTRAASKDVYAFLTMFFHTFPEYGKQDFHIAGESYAGHYIPQFASDILSHKKRNINLQSVLIGNGLTDGLTQYDYYRPMACGEGGYPSVLSESECRAMDDAYPNCARLIKSCYSSKSVLSCVPAALYCNNAMFKAYMNTGLNVYDIRSKCEDSDNLCYSEMGWIADYLNKPEVMAIVGAEVPAYQSCNTEINNNFLFNGDWMLPFQEFVPGLLKEIPVLIYAGDADYICNWLGNRAWTAALEWPGKSKFNEAKFEPFQVGGKEAGKYRAAANFTFIQIYQAGHMVPYNQPDPSLQMLNRWLGGVYWE